MKKTKLARIPQLMLESYMESKRSHSLYNMLPPNSSQPNVHT